MRIIGPMINPIIPLILKPTYIAINVYSGCIPNWDDTIRGSKNCLIKEITSNSMSMAIPNVTSPDIIVIIPHGSITVPEPNMGSKSTNPIPSDIRNGDSIFIPTALKIYKAISTIMKEININISSAFRYLPRTCTTLLNWLFAFFSHFFGMCCSRLSSMAILSVQMKYVARIVITR